MFYPEPVWAISVSNPRRRLKTGGAGELWVLGGVIGYGLPVADRSSGRITKAITWG